MSTLPVIGKRDGVAPVELLFDLVFVFAMSEIAHHLLGHLTTRGLTEATILLVGVFLVWLNTSWIATVLHAEEPRALTMILVTMLLSLFMNASIGRAWGSMGLMFALPLVVGQVGRSVWMVAASPNEVYREHYRRTVGWQLTSAPLWLIGAVSAPEGRLLYWGAATVIDLIGTWLAHPVPGQRLHSVHLEFDADHMLERCRLLLIVAFGETVVAMGSALASSRMTGLTVFAGVVAFAGMIALWALYFGSGVRATLDHIARTCDPVNASRLAGNALVVMVAGLIGIAVGSEIVIGATSTRGDFLVVGALLFGGAIAGLVAHAWYLRAVPRLSARWILYGAMGLAFAGLATASAPGLVQLGIWSIGLTALAVADTRAGRRFDSADSAVADCD